MKLFVTKKKKTIGKVNYQHNVLKNNISLFSTGSH